MNLITYLLIFLIAVNIVLGILLKIRSVQKVKAIESDIFIGDDPLDTGELVSTFEDEQ